MMYSYMHARNRHKFSYKINTMEINSRHLVRHAGSGYRLVRRGVQSGIVKEEGKAAAIRRSRCIATERGIGKT